MTTPSSQAQKPCVSVALDVPLRQSFSYLFKQIPPPIGARVWVPFGNRKMVGVVVAHSKTRPEGIKLKTISAVIDDQSLFSHTQIELFNWTAKYYHHFIGEVWRTAMPVVLRKGLPQLHGLVETGYTIKTLPENWSETLKRAPVQHDVVRFLKNNKAQCLHAVLFDHLPNARSAVQALLKKGWLVQTQQIAPLAKRAFKAKTNTLTSEQATAFEKLSDKAGQFRCDVLEGVTGSGKTEVYFSLIDKILERGEQVLLLLPEIALTDQLFSRFKQRFGYQVTALHSGMNDNARYRIWWQARSGDINIVLATRSGVFIEFKNLGLIIMDEEHDHSFKQHEGLRYHARSIAIKRAQLNNIPVVLGSATPSLETLHNIQLGRFAVANLRKRVGKSVLPQIKCIDLNVHALEAGLSKPAIRAMAETLKQKQQVLVFINRRGYAPVLYCPACQWTAQCKRCDAQMTTHHQRNLQCHHCGATRSIPQVCDACGQTGLIALGEGTQKIEEALSNLFPEARIQRFDRDELSTSNKLRQAMDKVHKLEIDILVGTQLLSKGHDFSGVNLVLVINADQGLYSIDFRAPELLVQQLIQVAGRAGRGEQQGRVLIQTSLPKHPALLAIRQHQYRAFAENELAQRALAQFPPYTHIALWRARARDAEQVMQFLQSVAAIGRQLQPADSLCFDPVKSPMFKRSGQYHAQLLVNARLRQTLHQWLASWIDSIDSRKTKTVKWSIDIDPVSLF